MKITIPLARDVLMLILGSGGMTHELFLTAAPDMIRVWASIGLLLGPAAWNSWWRLRNPEPPTPTPVGSSASPSSPPSPGS